MEPDTNNTVTVTADEAALRIRAAGALDDSHPISPEDRHRADFVGRVCDHLSLERTVENFSRVAKALDDLGIVPHAGHEYPKYVKTGKKMQRYDSTKDEMVDTKEDEQVTVHDANEEAEVTAGKHPASQPSPASTEPDPRTDTPTMNIKPTQPENGSADAPAEYLDAGQGKLAQSAAQDEQAAPVRKTPQAPRRA